MNHLKQYYVGYAALIALIIAIIYYVMMAHFTDTMFLYVTSPAIWAIVFSPLMLIGKFLIKGQAQDDKHQ